VKANSPRKKLSRGSRVRGQRKRDAIPSVIPSDRVPYISSSAKFSKDIDISDNGKFVITGTISERELRDAYLEWCMRRHGSEVIVSTLIGVSRKSVYNHIKRINGR
jgi:hypothetical protein